MSNPIIRFSAVIAFGVAAPAFATAVQAQTAKPAAKPQVAATQTATRAAMLKNIDSNFKVIDSNGDGVLNSAEIAAAEARVQQRRLAALRARVEGEFTKLDTNKDGQLSKAEFMAAAPQAPATAPTGANILAQLDKNKDGKLSGDEYRAPMLSRFDAIDSNHDGTLSAAEQQAAAQKRQQR